MQDGENVMTLSKAIDDYVERFLEEHERNEASVTEATDEALALSEQGRNLAKCIRDLNPKAAEHQMIYAVECACEPIDEDYHKYPVHAFWVIREAAIEKLKELGK